MAHIVANRVLVARNENVIKYGHDENTILFKPYNCRVAYPENPENVANAIESRVILVSKYPEMMQDKNVIKFTR